LAPSVAAASASVPRRPRNIASVIASANWLRLVSTSGQASASVARASRPQPPPPVSARPCIARL